MYRRPKSLEVLLDIRSAMSEECGYDVAAFVEMVRTGMHPADATRTVTRVDGDIPADLRPETVVETERIEVADD